MSCAGLAMGWADHGLAWPWAGQTMVWAVHGLVWPLSRSAIAVAALVTGWVGHGLCWLFLGLLWAGLAVGSGGLELVWPAAVLSMPWSEHGLVCSWAGLAVGLAEIPMGFSGHG
jgi:hypothetical protein